MFAAVHESRYWHKADMRVTAGGVIALLVHGWLGLKFLSRSWFNLDLVWAMSLILIGAIGLLTA